MRDLPKAVDRISAKATTQVIVDTAVGHARQRQRCHVTGRRRRVLRRWPSRASGASGNRSWSGAGISAHCRIRRNRRRRSARIVLPRPGERCTVQLMLHWRPVRGLSCRHHTDEPLSFWSAPFPGLLHEIFRDASQQVLERGHAIARFVREIGTAEKRPLVHGVQKHRQRPAARRAASGAGGPSGRSCRRPAAPRGQL